MQKYTIMILVIAVLFEASMCCGDWKMSIHKDGTVEEHAVADIDSMTFYNPPSMVLVPAGVFTMGDGISYCGVDEREVTLTNNYYLGQYEVTNQEYCDALQWAYDHDPPLVTVTSSFVSDNLDGSTAGLLEMSSSYCQISFGGDAFTVESGKENHPVVEVSWYGAAAYCDWLSMQAGYAPTYDHSDWSCNGGDPYGASGYRLPTDAEWEYATQYEGERSYPWGSEAPDCSRANYWPPSGQCVGSASAVGSYPPAPESLGIYDMAGNVWEWCNDWHTCDLGSDPVENPTGEGSGSDRVLRGGAWDYYGIASVRCSGRVNNYPPLTATYGFRCARTAE